MNPVSLMGAKEYDSQKSWDNYRLLAEEKFGQIEKIDERTEKIENNLSVIQRDLAVLRSSVETRIKIFTAIASGIGAGLMKIIDLILKH